MMKSAIFIGAAMVTLLAGNLARAEDCNMVNPSFEDDGLINDIAIQEPNGWSVDLLYGVFGGYVASNWATDGPYSLTLRSEKRKQYFAGDTARVSQQIDLIDVNYITFDVKLDTVYASAPWDPNECSAVLLIDDDVVWESNSVGPDVKGEYLDRVYVVEAKYKTENLHILSLGMRMNEDAYFWSQGQYQARWDMVDCNRVAVCGGGGYLDEDINRDCCVDANDLKLLAGRWLEIVDPNDLVNLSHVGDDPNGSGGTIDFLDYTLYAGGDPNFHGLDDITGHWLQLVDLDYEYNLFEGDDILPGGIIDFYDFAVLANAWMSTSYPDVNEP